MTTVTSLVDIGSTNSFTITVSNIALTEDGKSYTIPSWPLPQALINQGAPTNLKGLIDLVGSNNVTISYSGQLIGTVGKYNCSCNYDLNASIYYNASDQLAAGPTALWGTGGHTDRITINTAYVNIGAILPHNSPYSISSIRANQYNTSGCKSCIQDPSFAEVKMNIKAQVKVNLDAYCITMGTNNIHGDICFTYYKQKISDGNVGMDAQTTAYLTDADSGYCPRRFPGDQLDIFYTQPFIMDQKDYELCACNMPAYEYNEFKSSVIGTNPELGQFNAQCLFTPCYNSVFKPAALKECPTPNCINIVSMNGSTVDGPLTVNQDIEGCSNVEVINPAPQGPIPSPPAQETFLQKYGWLILLAICALVLMLLVVGGGYAAYQYSQTSSSTDTSER